MSATPHSIRFVACSCWARCKRTAATSSSTLPASHVADARTPAPTPTKTSASKPSAPVFNPLAHVQASTSPGAIAAEPSTGRPRAAIAAATPGASSTKAGMCRLAAVLCPDQLGDQVRRVAPDDVPPGVERLPQLHRPQHQVVAVVEQRDGLEQLGGGPLRRAAGAGFCPFFEAAAGRSCPLSAVSAPFDPFSRTSKTMPLFCGRKNARGPGPLMASKKPGRPQGPRGRGIGYRPVNR